jgi:hypothetical protein
MRSTRGLSHKSLEVDEFLAAQGREWTICGKSSAYSMHAGGCSTCVAAATMATFTAWMEAMTPSVLRADARESSSTGGAIAADKRLPSVYLSGGQRAK